MNVLEQRLADGLLTPEQRTRIIMALERRLFLLPKGALGVQMEMVEGQPANDEAERVGVRIVKVLPGLPARFVLQPGDVVTHIGGEAMRDGADLIRVVQSHWPGDEIRVQALRHHGSAWVELDVVVTLGSMEQLLDREGWKRPPGGDDLRYLEQLRRTHGPLRRTLIRPAEAGRGSAAWIVDEVARQRAQLTAHRDVREQAVLVARWTTWLKAVDSKLGDRFLDPDRRAALGRAREALEAAIEQFGVDGR